MKPSVSYIDKLQRANADDLAFYPVSSLERALDAGHIITCEENDEPAGYLWFGSLRPGRDVVIYQACVDYEARRRHLGWGMVANLRAMAEAAGCVGIKLKCASSAASNEFWRMIGFYCTSVRKGGIKRGRDINCYRTDLQPTLFSPLSVQPSAKPSDQRAYRELQRTGFVMPSRFSRVHYGENVT